MMFQWRLRGDIIAVDCDSYQGIKGGGSARSPGQAVNLTAQGSV